MDATPTTPRAERAVSGTMPGSSTDAQADSGFRTPLQKRAMSEAGDSDRGGKFQTIAAKEESSNIPPELCSPTSPAKSEVEVAGQQNGDDGALHQQGKDGAGAGQEQRQDGVGTEQEQSDGKMDPDIIEEISYNLITHIDCKKNLNNIEQIKKKFGKLKPQKGLIEMVLELTHGNGSPVSRADRPPLLMSQVVEHCKINTEYKQPTR